MPDSEQPSINPEPGIEEDGKPSQSTPFPVVGIGASAGGLEALTQLLSALSVSTGMAFVVVQHLDPVTRAN